MQHADMQVQTEEREDFNRKRMEQVADGAIATRQGRRRLSARTHVRMYIMYHCWRKISYYCFTALAILKTILVFFGVVEAPQDYGRGGVSILIHE